MDQFQWLLLRILPDHRLGGFYSNFSIIQGSAAFQLPEKSAK